MSCVVITATTLWCLLLRPLCPAMAAASAEDRPQTVEQWREDIDFFARELPARHFEFYQLIPRERFEREISRLRRELPDLEDAEIILRLRRIVAELHVAHTHISLGPGLGAHAFHSYPVRFRWFSDGLVVTAATPEYQRALGCRVVRIGSKSPVQVERIVSPYISYENETHLHRAGARCMSLVELMQREKVVGPDAHMQLTCMPVSGPPFTLDIPPRGEPADAEESIDLLEAPGSAEDPVEPVGARLVRIEKTLHIPKGFARSRRGAYWYAYLPDTQTLYIQYNHCRNAPDETFQDFTNRVFAFADRRSVRRVVVDLRFNGGGSSSVFAPMVGALRSRPALTTRGRLYALIGPGTFSAAVFAVRDLRDGLNAILVGEPTGNKQTTTGRSRNSCCRIRSCPSPSRRSTFTWCETAIRLRTSRMSRCHNRSGISWTAGIARSSLRWGQKPGAIGSCGRFNRRQEVTTTSGADKMALPVFLMCFAAGSSGAATLQNGAMLEFRLEDTFGREVRARDYRGVPVAILCGACWCGGCQQDAGPFNDLARQFTRRGVQFIRSVSGDNSLTSLEFQKHYRLAMVNLLDPNRAFEKQYNDDGWTFIMLADRSGRVVYRANSPDMGEIATRLEDLATHSSGPATIVRDRVPYMRATLERSGEIHTSRRLDVFPSIASWPDGRLYVVFTSNRRGSSDVYLRRYEAGRWSEDEPIAATEADEFDGSVIVDQSGEVWISWASDSGGRNYNIFVTRLDASGRLKPPTQLTRASDDAMHARLACDRSGFIWCAYYRWQKLGRASRDKEVYVRRFANGEWSLEMHVSPEDVPGYEDHTEPVMAPYEDGVVVGWSWDFHRPEGYTADAASPTIFLRAIARDFIMGPAVHASGRSIDVTPALATDGKKSVWCAWDAGEWDNRLRVTRRSLRVCRRDLDADRPDAEEALSPQVANICTPNLVAGSGGALSAVWSQNDNGNRWVLRRAAWDPARAKWQPSEEVESEGNPRFPSATCDARGVIWVAYSADSDNGSVIRIKALSPRSR